MDDRGALATKQKPDQGRALCGRGVRSNEHESDSAC